VRSLAAVARLRPRRIVGIEFGRQIVRDVEDPRRIVDVEATVLRCW
jgi:hypothetical protein